jgi:hypothetical protein
MHSFKALPTEQRVMNMNKFQWLWCYYNIIEEENKKIKNVNDIVEYMTYFMNMDLAKAVKENKEKKESKYKETNIRNADEVYNDDFDAEVGEYLKNERFVELPSSNYKSCAETKDEFIDRALEMEKFANQYNYDLLHKDDDLDIIYTNNE